jgi:hypothetical protein
MEKQETRGGTRTGAGRPALYEGKPAFIQLKAEPERKSRYVKAAQSAGKTLRDWIFDACDKELHG